MRCISTHTVGYNGSLSTVDETSCNKKRMRRGRSVFLMATAQNQFSVETGRVKNAFLQETFERVQPGELAAEPVPTLRKALNLRDYELLCSGKRATD